MDKNGSCYVRRKSLVGVVGFAGGIVLMYIMLVGNNQHLENISSIHAAGSEEVRAQLIVYLHNEDPLCASPNLPCPSEISNRNKVFQNSTWEGEQNKRRHLVRNTCSDMKMPTNITLTSLTSTLAENRNIIIDPKHNIMFCAIPKAACSSWKMAIALLTEQMSKSSNFNNIHSPYFMNSIGLPSVAYLNDRQLWKVVKEFTKFLVVRHPLERLVSAYRDKFKTYNKWTKRFQLKYGRKIVSLYREQRDLTFKSLRKGHDVTFSEFLTFILDDSIPYEDRMNPHWDTYQNLCHPCLINYNHVIKFESLNIDNDMVLKQYFSVNDSTEFFPKRNVKEVPSRDLMLQYYSTVPAEILHKVFAFYKTDMDMFGYSIPQGILDNTW